MKAAEKSSFSSACFMPINPAGTLQKTILGSYSLDFSVTIIHCYLYYFVVFGGSYFVWEKEERDHLSSVKRKATKLLHL